jgi:hypothetical protein
LSPSTTNTQQLRKLPGTNDYEERTIRFQVESEDLGQKVRGLVFIDYKGVSKDFANPPPILSLDIRAGTLKEEPRSGEFVLSVRSLNIMEGCHPISLVLSHDFAGGFAPAEEGDFAIATWFFYFGIDPNNPKEGENFICQPDPIPRDAGTDAREGGGL